MKCRELAVASRAVLGCDFQSPWQGCRAAEQLWLNQLPNLPMAWATRMAGATASSTAGKTILRRRATR